MVCADLLFHIVIFLHIATDLLIEVWYWSYSTVRKYGNPYLRTLGRDPRDTFRTYIFHSTGLCNIKTKNGLTGEQLAVGTDSRSVSTGPSRMFSVLTEGCHVGYSREFVGTVYRYLRTVEYDYCFVCKLVLHPARGKIDGSWVNHQRIQNTEHFTDNRNQYRLLWLEPTKPTQELTQLVNKFN